MRLVLDTSAAVCVVRRAPGWEDFDKVIQAAEWVESPDLFIAEAANVFWKFHGFGKLSVENVEAALEQAVSIPDEFTPCAGLYREALALAITGQRPAYDMFFLALARRNNAVLLSADRGLLDFAKKHDVKTFTSK